MNPPASLYENATSGGEMHVGCPNLELDGLEFLCRGVKPDAK